MTKEKVLILGDDTRSFLSMVRSLGRRGIVVHAAPGNLRSPALRSRYIVSIHVLPPWMGEGAEWLGAISELLRAERYSLVIPCNETVLLPVHHHRATLSRFARLAIPDSRAMELLYDKSATRSLAKGLGIPVTSGRLARPDDNAEAVLAEFGLPIVLKPRRSYSLERLSMRGKVEVVYERARLEQLWANIEPGKIILERYFDGQGVGVSVLASGGRLLQAFEHHRAREVEGASFYRKSAPLTRELVEACEKITFELGYTGLAMFEFKRAESGSWVLLEVNARPWGSMPLPVALGVDFPYRWYQLLVAGENKDPPITYRTGVYGRNLIPDLRMWVTQANTQRLGGTAKAAFVIRRVAEFARILNGREVNDVFVRDDPRPAFFELLDIVRSVERRLEKFRPGFAARRRRLARNKVKMVLARESRPHIVFVCQGNICRSPFAQALLGSYLGSASVACSSAGMMAQPGRLTPVFGLEAASAYGIDLSVHRSSWLDPQRAFSASLVVVFDEINRNSVLDRYPDLRTPIVLLGDLIGSDEIPDPVDGDAAIYRLVYEQIAAAIRELARLINCTFAARDDSDELFATRQNIAGQIGR